MTTVWKQKMLKQMYIINLAIFSTSTSGYRRTDLVRNNTCLETRKKKSCFIYWSYCIQIYPADFVDSQMPNLAQPVRAHVHWHTGKYLTTGSWNKVCLICNMLISLVKYSIKDNLELMVWGHWICNWKETDTISYQELLWTGISHC